MNNKKKKKEIKVFPKTFVIEAGEGRRFEVFMSKKKRAAGKLMWHKRWAYLGSLLNLTV